jgi:hypothetical protein
VLLGDTETGACPKDRIGNSRNANRAEGSFILMALSQRELAKTIPFCEAEVNLFATESPA